jgi:hypothetical protein
MGLDSIERGIKMKKVITYYNRKMLLICDGKCDKAWGVSSRPKIQLSETDENDYCYLADDELEIALEDPLTYEGLDMEGKPTCDEEKMNRWCCRECERSSINDLLGEIEVKDFSKRRYNYLSKNI